MTTTLALNSSERIIRLAMKDAGLLQDLSDPTPDQFSEYMGRLNDILNFAQTQGLKLWLQVDTAVPLTANKATYNLGPAGDVVMTKPLRVLQAYYLDTGGIRRPLVPLSRDEHMRLSQVTQTGAVNSYFVDKQQLQLAVSLWLVPDATAALGTVHLLLETQVTNLVQITDTMAFPQEWFIYLRWALADDLSTGQPQAIMARCSQKAETYRMMLEDWDVEDTPTKFEPDSRSQYYQNSFN